VIKGATENAAVTEALLDNLIERGLDPAVCRRRASKPPPMRGAG